ncbi:MAG: methylamine utilization protein [Steroidobacteraceae bacterium]
MRKNAGFCGQEAIAPGMSKLRGDWVVAFGVVALSLSTSVLAAPLTVQVLDRSGKPVPEVVVTFNDGRSTAVTPTNLSMTMDQMSMRFVPQVLVVPTGASVKFPNSDSVSHQVYSFSPAKTFQISLYKNNSTSPAVLFDKPGLVVVGCNIHDSMVGYVYVTDAAGYGKTDARGAVNWNVPNNGSVSITLWSPLLAEPEGNLKRTVQITANTAQQVEFKLSKALRTNPQPQPRHTDWDY